MKLLFVMQRGEWECCLHSSASKIKNDAENGIEIALALPGWMYNYVKTMKGNTGMLMGEASITNITDGQC